MEPTATGSLAATEEISVKGEHTIFPALAYFLWTLSFHFLFPFHCFAKQKELSLMGSDIHTVVLGC